MKQSKYKILFFYTSGGRVLLAGIGLTLLLILILAYYGITTPETARTLGLVFAAHSFGGRAAGIGLCMLDGLGIISTILYNFLLEIQIVCLLYGLFVLSIHNYINVKWIDNLSANMMKKAVKHSEIIRAYGWIGLFIFVMLPLPVTGPVMGSILGYLLNIPIFQNFSAVFMGTLTAIVAWVFCFDFLEQHLHIIQYLIVGLIAFVIISHIKRIKKWFRNQ